MLTGDLYRFQDLLPPAEADVVSRVRDFLATQAKGFVSAFV
jgi:glutaryl-CoA dehydrogenase